MARLFHCRRVGLGQSSRMTPFRDILRIPAQRRLLLAAIPADFADWFDYVAVVALIAYVWGQGPLALAFLALAFSLPYVVAGPLLAAWVDRAELKRVLLWSNLGRGVLTFALAVAPNVEVLADRAAARCGRLGLHPGAPVRHPADDARAAADGRQRPASGHQSGQ